MTHVIYNNCSTFQKKHDGQYSKGIGVFKFENFHVLVNLFSLFTIFIVYNFNNSYFIHEISSKFQQNHFGRYAKGIGVFKVKIFHIFGNTFLFLFTLFTVFNLNILCYI